MSWIVVIGVVAACAVWLLFGAELLEDGLAIAAVIVGIIAAITLLVMGGIHASRDHDRRVCYGFGEATERVVKFEQFSYISWECLTPTDDGWVGIDRIRDTDE